MRVLRFTERREKSNLHSHDRLNVSWVLHTDLQHTKTHTFTVIVKKCCQSL